MDIITHISELRSRLSDAGRIAFVPTMGNLHDGHIALIKMARERGDCVVASIFVNPLQFGANEDLANYPRTPEADYTKLAANGTDVVFTPTEQVLYPEPQIICVEPPQISQELCGAFRPGHFRGVATVVLKLFNIVQPDIAIFGKKDYQQLHILRLMTHQLELPIEIIAAETTREADGLAMSSRNGYLSAAQRQEAPRLYRALKQVVQAAQEGKMDFSAIETQTRDYLVQLGWMVDYIEIRDAVSLGRPESHSQKLVALAAARLGKTRLIDNIEFAL